MSFRVRFYVASAFANYAAVRETVDLITAMGHDVTHDWTRADGEGAEAGRMEENPEADPEALTVAAQEDVRGVLIADVVILLWAPDMMGAYVETGIAIAAGKRVWLVGPVGRESIFWALPNVSRFPDRAAFLRRLEREFA